MVNKSLLDLTKEAEIKFQHRRESFIQNHTLQENCVNSFLDELRSLPNDITNNLQIDEDMDYKSFFPSLFKEPIDEEAYKEEFQKYVEFEKKIKSFENTINTKAREVLENYVGK